MTEWRDNIENFCSCGQPSMWDHDCEITEVTDMSEAMDYEVKRQAQVEAINDNIRELQYLLAPQYEAQAERLKRLYYAEKRRVDPSDEHDLEDAKKCGARLHGEIADGHALINPLLAGIELLQKALALL